MRRLRVICLSLVLCGLLPVFGQEKHALTNAEVVQLVKAGIPESTIILAIKQTSNHFDTSPKALIDLKNQGVSQVVMEAMLHSTKNVLADPSPKATATSPLKKDDELDSLAEGTYYKSPHGWLKMQTISMAGGGAKHMGKMFVPGLTPQMVWTFRGAEAPIQITETKPIFLLKQSPYLVDVPGHSDRDLIIVRFDKKSDHRELQTTSGGTMFTFKSGFSKERTTDIAVTKISESSYTVTPKTDLPVGEYMLTFGSAGMGGFDFGLKAEK